MPTYEYRCGVCHFRTTAYRKIAERDTCPPCDRCQGQTERRITPTMVSVFQPYRSVVADKESGERPMIRNAAEHRSFLARNGFEEVGNDKSMAPPSREEFLRKRAEKLKEQEKAEFSFDTGTHEAYA